MLCVLGGQTTAILNATHLFERFALGFRVLGFVFLIKKIIHNYRVRIHTTEESKQYTHQSQYRVENAQLFVALFGDFVGVTLLITEQDVNNILMGVLCKYIYIYLC